MANNIISSRKIKSLLKDYNLEFKLSQIKINGTVRGCSGFIKKDNVIIYINTERNTYSPLSNKILVRYAKDFDDWKGGTNNFINIDSDLKKELLKFLSNERNYEFEFR